MELISLYCNGVRNLQNVQCAFDPKLNMIVGKNGQGKSSLLEAIYLISTGSSFRTDALDEVITHGGKGFFVAASIQQLLLTSSLELSFDGKKRKIAYNGTTYDRQIHLLGKLLTVLVPPDIALLVKGEKWRRRHFFNVFLSQIDPLYVHHLYRYTRAMKQRNILLRKNDLTTIRAWEKELALSAGYIVHKRLEVVEKLSKEIQGIFLSLVGKHETLELRYDPILQENGEKELAAFYEAEFERKRVQEVILGSTLTGPHRDDLVLMLEGKEARHYASEGELKSIAYALKLAEYALIERLTEEKPLFLIDDMSAFVDSFRLDNLISILEGLGQVFITCHSKELHSKTKGKLFTIENGICSS